MVTIEKEIKSAPRDPFTLVYLRQFGDVLKNQLTIDSGGNAYAYVRHTVPGSPLRALGIFFSPLGFDDKGVAEIGRLIRDGKLLEGRPFSVTPTVGMQFVTFMIEADGKEATHLQNGMEPLPLPLVNLERSILRLAERLNGDPQRTLFIKTAFEPASITPGKDLRISLKFRNDGKFPVAFRNPAAFIAGGSNTIRINFWERVVDEHGKESEDYRWTLDLVGKEWLLEERKTISSDRPFLEIAPNSEIHAWTTLRFPKSAKGKYFTELVYYSAPPSDAEKKMSELVTGEYHGDIVPITVSAH